MAGKTELYARRRPEEGLFTGKIFFIAGMGGIGRGVAKAAQFQGAIVVGLDTSFILNEQIVLPREKDWGEKRIMFGADVTNQDQMNKVAEAAKRLRQLDVVVLTAGIGQSKPGGVSDEEAARIRSVNVDGVKNTMEALELAGLIAPDATVVYVSSDLVNLIGQTNLPAYVSSKRELEKYVLAQTKEDAIAYRQRRSLILCLGPVDTGMFRTGKDKATVARIRKEHGIMGPDECGEIIVHKIIPHRTTYPSGSRIRIYQGKAPEIIP